MRKNGIHLDNVSLNFEDGGFRLRDINLYIPQGSFVGIVGNNGSGKSTLTYLMNGLIPSQIKAKVKGRVTVDGEDTKTKSVSHFSKKVGMVFQNPDFMIFNLTVKEEIEFGLNNLGIKDKEKRVKKALEEVGLKGFEDRDPQTLSLGQKQKVCLASILALETPYIVLDEPTAMLDHRSSVRLFEILKDLHKKGRTIIIAEHETDYLKNVVDTVVVVDKGEIVKKGDAKKVFSDEKLLERIGIKIP